MIKSDKEKIGQQDLLLLSEAQYTYTTYKPEGAMMLPKILNWDCLNGLSSATDVGKDKAVIPVPAQPCNQPHHGLMQLKTHSGETLFLWDL